MGFLDDLGGIFHSIGNFIGGGGNNAPQQSNSNQISVAPQQNNNRPNPGAIIQPQQNNRQPQQQPQQQQPQGPTNQINLTQPLVKANQPPAFANNPTAVNPAGPKAFNLNDLTNGTLAKASPINNPTNDNSPDPVGSFLGKVVHPFAQFGNALIHVPQAVYREVQNKPINDIQQNVFGTTDSGQIAKDIVGDTAQTALAVGTGGLDSAVEKGGTELLPNVAPSLVKAGAKVITGANVGGAFGGVNAAENNQNVVKGIEQGFAVGGIGGGLSAGIPLLNKAGTATDIKTGLDATADKAPDEIAVGLKSTNPNQGADALTAIQQKEAEANANVAPVAGEPQPNGGAAGPTQQQLPLQVSERPNSPAEANTATATQVQPASPATQELQPAGKENISSPNNVAQGEANVNPQAPNAPNVRDQLTKQLGIAAKEAGDPTEHDVLSNGDLKAAANQAVQATPPAELLNKYSGVPNLNEVSDLAHAHASLPVLADLSKNADPQVAAQAKAAIDNIIEGSEKGVSSGARTLNFAQGMYDNLPTEAKVSLTVRTLDKARDAAGMPLIRDNTALQNEVETKLTNLVSTGEDLKNQLAGVQGKIQEIQDAAKSGQAPPDAAAQLGDLGKQQAQLQLRSDAQNGETARYYNSLLPGKAGLQKAADWARTSMLTAPSGRVNNFFNVGGNSLYEIARSIPQAVIGKMIDLTKGAGTTQAATLVNKGLATGFKQGLQKTVSELRGNALLGDLTKSVRSDSGNYELLKTADNRGLNKVVNITQAAVRAPGNIVGGALRNAQLLRSAAQEAAQLGLKGSDADIYTQARALVPTKAMADNAQLLQDTVSHMNKNPFSDFMGKIFKTEAGPDSQAKGAVGLIKNTFLPFPKYASTFAWNTLTDRNVVADSVRAATSLAKGDMTGFSRAIAGGTVDGSLMYVGYHLAHMGLITNKDANGYSDAGAYLHLGNRYIPLGFLGVNGEGLLAGAGIFNAANGKGNPVTNYAKTIIGTIANTARMAGAQSLVGADNTALSAIQNAVTGKNNVSPNDAAAAVGGEFAGTFIPGLATDVNAGLNHSPLNPSGENAQTKVTKGQSGQLTKTGSLSTAKNIPASTVLSLENRVPFLSQTLPRAPGTTANDLIDRVDRGSHVGAPQAAILAKANIPNTPAQQKAALAADKQTFIQSQKPIDTINGKTYINYKGNVTSFDDPQKAQQALDYAKFKDSNQDFQQVNGMVYQKGSDGKTTAMEQKDYDYKNANDQITSSKNSGDVTGYASGTQALLGNISWQLQHADLTQENRDALIQKAVQQQEDYAKTAQYGGFTKPKGVATYATPTITGAKSGYVKEIQAAGAKYGVDINALLSVAAQEGLGGGVGDNGTSFGPFQLHEGGALPPGKDQAWAESPAGIDYAVQQIANVAKGKTGADAINAIVSQFEKSADPATEAANAIALYQGGNATLSPGGTGVASLTPSSSSSTSAANLVKSNKIGSLPQLTRESFINNFTNQQPVLNLPEAKLTQPDTLIKAHKISVGTPRA